MSTTFVINDTRLELSKEFTHEGKLTMCAARDALAIAHERPGYQDDYEIHEFVLSVHDVRVILAFLEGHLTKREELHEIKEMTLVGTPQSELQITTSPFRYCRLVMNNVAPVGEYGEGSKINRYELSTEEESVLLCILREAIAYEQA